MRPYDPGRRRPAHRLERDRADRHTARARASRRADARHLDRRSTRRRRWTSAPPTGGRRTSPRASRSRSATSPTRRGNKLGVVVFGDDAALRARAAPGPSRDDGAAQRRCAAPCRGGARSGDSLATRCATGKLARQRALVVVISDFRGAARLAPAAARARRAARGDRRRGPRPARAGAPRRGRAAARRPRDRPPAARQHLERGAARALRGRRRGGAEELAAMLACAGVRHAVVSTEGDWLRRSPRSCERAGRDDELRLAVVARLRCSPCRS